MKSKILLTTIGVAILATFTLSASANDVALSPRAKDNQIQVVSGIANDPNLLAVNNNGVALSPRAADNQIKTVSGTNNDPNVATGCRNMMTGSSPKAIAACEANPAMPGCRITATASAK